MIAMPMPLRLGLPRLAAIVLFFSVPVPASAQQPSTQLAGPQIAQLDPARSAIEITLDAFLHTVHGAFRATRGSITFDPATGKASGLIAIDAASGNTGNDGRDKTMHRKVLESARFSEITFTPAALDGLLSEGDSQVTLRGVLNLHGRDHDVAPPAKVHIARGRYTADLDFPIPYVMWGLKNPSNLVLHVKDVVEVHVHAAGTIGPAG